MIFVSSDKELLKMTVHGARLYSFIYLVAGINVFGSGFFTALGNGLVSGALALIRIMMLEAGAVLLLPFFWGIDGIWIAAFAADLLMLALTTAAFAKMRRWYNY